MQWEFWDYDVSASEAFPVMSVEARSSSTPIYHAPSSTDCFPGLHLVKKQASERATSFIDENDSVFKLVCSQEFHDLNHPSQETTQAGTGDETNQRTIGNKKKINIRRKTVASEHPVWINKWQDKFRNKLAAKSSIEYDHKGILDKNPLVKDSTFLASTRPKSGAPPAA
ncbi:hypothetical protein ACHAXS_001981 [Conticribra weissflogii]